MRAICLSLFFATLLAVGTSSPAQADTITFTRQSSNATTDISSQLTVEVAFGTGTVTFKFLNNLGGSGDGSITDIYFHDDLSSLFTSSTGTISDSGAGVAFSSPASPNSPPTGGGEFGSRWDDVMFSLDSDAPPSQNGVDSSSEYVAVTYTLAGSVTETNVRNALGTTTLGTSTIALHAQSIGTESDWFYGSGLTAVPEPGTIVLLGLGLAGIAGVRRRRQNTSVV